MTKAIYEEGDWRKPNRAKRTELTEPQERFLEWLTDAEVQLKRQSQNDFAAEIGVNKATLSKWKKDPIFVKAWEARLVAMNVNPERMQNLMEVLYDQGRNGNVKSIELYFRLNDRMTPERIVNIDEKAADDMTDAELADELERRAAKLRG